MSSQLTRPVVKQARSQLSTRKLLDAAADLISEVGYERTTLAAISARAGYSHGLVTRRFGSKEAMLWSLVERMTFDWAAEHQVPHDGAGPEAVLRVIDVIRDGIIRAPRELRSLNCLMFEAIKPIPVLQDRIRELHDRFRDSVRARVVEGIDAGVIPASVDAEVFARILVGGVRGCTYQWVLDPSGFDAVQALSDLRDALAQLLQSPTD